MSSETSSGNADGWGPSGYMPDLPDVPEDDTPKVSISYGETFRALLSRRLIVPTLFVLLGMAGMVSLGIWQIDRLQQRRAFNALVMERFAAEPYDLATQGLPDNLDELEYRRIQANGSFDYDNQMLLTNQPGPNGEPGAQLITPLVFANGDGATDGATDGAANAVLVARGWVPNELQGEENWPQFVDPPDAPVIGMIQASQPLEEGAPVAEGFQREWWRVDVARMQEQLPYTLIPAFLLQLAEPGRTLDTFPSRFVNFSLDEGDHLSYSVQWFSFALILGFGYIQFVRMQESRRRRQALAQANGDLPANAAADAPGVEPTQRM
jgi:surfeit locus 1 family protein